MMSTMHVAVVVYAIYALSRGHCQCAGARQLLTRGPCVLSDGILEGEFVVVLSNRHSVFHYGSALYTHLQDGAADSRGMTKEDYRL